MFRPDALPFGLSPDPGFSSWVMDWRDVNTLQLLMGSGPHALPNWLNAVYKLAMRHATSLQRLAFVISF